ncbi:MAG TPA: hypothetical protein VEP90_10885 [Methylomirabilota bacterium]|nr:hypothetical protein [Methylomirabilota bacterium]
MRIEAVGDVLNRFCVPKYMIGYLVTLSSGDVKNIGGSATKRLIDLATTKDPEKQG